MAYDASHHYVPLHEARKHIPGLPSQSTLYRWMATGVAGTKLETIKAGGRRFVSLENLRSFILRVTEEADGEQIPRVILQEREQVEVEQELDAIGITGHASGN